VLYAAHPGCCHPIESNLTPATTQMRAASGINHADLPRTGKLNQVNGSSRLGLNEAVVVGFCLFCRLVTRPSTNRDTQQSDSSPRRNLYAPNTCLYTGQGYKIKSRASRFSQTRFHTPQYTFSSASHVTF